MTEAPWAAKVHDVWCCVPPLRVPQAVNTRSFACGVCSLDVRCKPTHTLQIKNGLSKLRRLGPSTRGVQSAIAKELGAGRSNAENLTIGCYTGNGWNTSKSNYRDTGLGGGHWGWR